MSLKVSATLSLPLDAATSTFGILATKGAGKSNAAVVMAEELHDARVPWVAIDPKGDWWGIRSSANGKGPGLPVVVFGGRHGDVPLEPTAGALLADLIIEQRLSCVLDVSEFTKGETTRFLLAFAQRLFRLAEHEPLHLFLEEAHEYLPQQVRGDQAEMVGAWQRIVKQGRFKGLGCTLISQRAAVVNKDVLELVDTLIVLRTIGPRSRDAVAGWVRDQDVDAGLLASLPTLADGEAWVWSPGALGLMQRVKFRRRRTFDSGATPKVGEARRAPATLADVDLAAIKEQMAETIERAKADDPKALRKRIAELERELKARPTETVVQEVVRDVVPPWVPELTEQARQVLDDVLARAAAAGEGVSGPGAGASDAPAGRDRSNLPKAASTSTPSRPEPRARAQSQAEAVMRALPAADGVKLGRAERAILTVLAQHPPGRGRTQLAFLAGYSHKSSGYANALGALRSAGYITKAGDPIRATDEGVAALGEYEQLPTGAALLGHWMERLGKAERTLLLVFVQHAPSTVDRATLAEESGYSSTSSGFANALGRLRSLEMVDGWQLHPDFAEAIR